jgi:hypothetical protein
LGFKSVFLLIDTAVFSHIELAEKIPNGTNVQYMEINCEGEKA